jgi:glucose-1-phosphate thymidylyltransferase
MQRRQGAQIACLEEIAYRNGFIGKEDLRRLGRALERTEYGRYILSVAEDEA